MEKNVSQIRWQQIFSLLALDVAIIISWIAYHEYQPKLLEQFNFTDFSFALTVIQAIVLTIMPPIAGLIADKIRKKGGHQLPVITVGVSVTAMVFMAVAFTVLQNPVGDIRWILPFMITLWLISMNIFHSPAISTIELFVPAEKLPQVIALFVIVTDLVRAIEPIIVDIIDFFGAPLTFAAGGVLILGTGFLLKKTSSNLPLAEEEKRILAQSNTNSNFQRVLVLGFAVGIATTLLLNIFPNIYDVSLAQMQNYELKGNFFVSILLVISALVSYPISRWVEERNLQTLVLAGFVGLFLLATAIFVISNPYLLGILSVGYVILFALISVCSLPIAFSNISAAQKVFGIGLFFSGVELANGLVDILLQM